MSFLSILLEVLVGGVLGIVVHELAHFVVWRATGRQASIQIRDNWLHVDPGEDLSLSMIEPRDKVAAVAPVVLAVLFLPLLVLGPLAFTAPFLLYLGVSGLLPGSTDWQVIRAQPTQQPSDHR